MKIREYQKFLIFVPTHGMIFAILVIVGLVRNIGGVKLIMTIVELEVLGYIKTRLISYGIQQVHMITVTSWIPYIEVATFKLGGNLTYDNNTKYRVTDKEHAWLYGSAMPSADGRLSVVAYTTSGNASSPHMNLAFGIFNDITKKWDMTSLINSSHALPVINDEGKEDFNWGDFLTIRQHVGNNKDKFIWDVGGFVLSGNQSTDTDRTLLWLRTKIDDRVSSLTKNSFDVHSVSLGQKEVV